MIVLRKMMLKSLTKQNWIDLAIIFLIPVILFTVFLLPNQIKESLILHREASTIYSIFTTHFVHMKITHLISNVISYLIVVLFLYTFLFVMDKTNFFRKFLFTNLLLMPFLISFIWVPVNQFISTGVKTSFGFSGIVSSLFGTFIYVYVILLHERVKIKTHFAYISSIFFVLLLFILFYFKSSLYTVMILILVAIVFGWSAYKTVKSINKKAKTDLIKKAKRPKYAKIFLYISVFVLYLFIFVSAWHLFPIKFVIDNITINFFIHYVGFILGLSTSFVTHYFFARK